MDFFNRVVGLSGKAELGRLGVDDDEHGVRVVGLDEVVDGYVVAVETWSCVIPTHDSFSR